MTDKPSQIDNVIEINNECDTENLEKEGEVEEGLHYLSEKSIFLYKVPDEIEHARTPVSTPKELITDCYISILPNIPENIKDVQVPYIREVGIRDAIASLANFFNCPDYKNNLVQFWFLDIIVDCLWRTQDEFRFSIPQQICVLEWLLFIFRLISSFGMTKTLLFQIFYEAMAIAEDYVQAGGTEEPSPNKLFAVKLENSSDSIGKLSFHSSSIIENVKSSINLTPSKQYVVIKSKEKCQVYKLPTKQVTVDCLSSSIGSASEEQIQVEKEETSKIFSINETSEESEIDFYKVDNSTPPRFKSLQELNKISEESSLNDLKYNVMELNKNIGDWYDIPRKARLPFCSSKTVIEHSPIEGKSEGTLMKQNNVISNSNIVTHFEDNIEPLSSKDIFKAFYDYNLWKLKNKFMNNSKIGWSSLSNEQILPQNPENSQKNLPNISLKQRDIENEKELFVKSCVLMSTRQIITDYFENNFTFELVRMTFTNPQFLITQDINVYWNIPKDIKGEIKKPVPKKPKKEKVKKKEKPKKEKSKSSKASTKGKKSKKSEKKSKSDKKSKSTIKSEKTKKKILSKEEQKELERLRKEQEELERELIKQAENKMFMFPLKDAVDEIFFTKLFPNYKKKGAAKSEKASKKSDESKPVQKARKKKQK